MHGDGTALNFTSPCTSEVNQLVPDDLNSSNTMNQWKVTSLITNQSKKTKSNQITKFIYSATQKGLKKGSQI